MELQTVKDVQAKKFTTRGLFRKGYDVDEVDAYLDEIAATIFALHRELTCPARVRREATGKDNPICKENMSRAREEGGVMAKDPNLIVLRGRLTADPELRTAGATGVSVVRFCVVSSGRSKNSTGEWVDGEPTFWNCEAWRDLAEHIASSFVQGLEVLVWARPKTSAWTDKQGQKRSRVEWLVEDMGPSMLHATAQVTRVRSAPGFRSAPQGVNPGDGPAPAPPTGDEYADEF